MESQKFFSEQPVGKVILKTSLPCMLTMLVMIVYNMADTYFIGRLGDPLQVAAVSLAAPVMAILSGLGTLIGGGGCAAIATVFGKKEYDKAKAMSSFCCYASLAVGTLFFLVILLFQNQIVPAIGASENTFQHARIYLLIVAASGPFSLFASSMSNVVRAEGAVKQSMLGNTLGSVINIILDPLFILVFGMGVAGAAIATVIGNIFACLYYVAYCGGKKSALNLSPRHFTLRRDISLKVLALGVPTCASILLSSLSSILNNNLVAGYGDIPVAAMGVAGKVTMVVGMMQMAVCIGPQPAMAFNFGAGNIIRLKTFVKQCAAATCIIGTLLAAVVALCNRPLILFFIDNMEVLAYGQMMVIAAVITGPIVGLCNLSTSFLQSTDKAGHATLISVLRQGVILMPLLYILNSLAGLQGLVYSSALADTISTLLALALMLRVYKGLAVKQPGAIIQKA